MKHILQKSALLCAFGLMAIIIANFVRVEAFTVPTSLNNDYLQRVRLHTLLLGNNEDVRLNIVNKSDKLYMGFGTGLVVGKDSVVNGNSQYVVIGGGEGNTIGNYSSFAGIAGGEANKTWNDTAVIGGGWGNSATGINAVIVGGAGNRARPGGVVVGGKTNTAYESGVVLGGRNNQAKKNSLALGVSVEAEEGAFGWNAAGLGNIRALENSARIDATNGTLIGSYKAIAGVNLVVSGAVKLEGKPLSATDAIKGEIRAVNGCIYANDGHGWHVITRGVETDSCGAGGLLLDSCEFGNTLIWDGDIVQAFQNAYFPTRANGAAGSKINSCITKSIICHNGHLYEVKAGTTNEPDTNLLADYYYPYCYKLN